MVPLLHVYTLVVALEVCLAHKLLVAVVDGAWEWIFALLVMGLHMRLEIVTPAEQLATSLDLALKVGLLLGGQAPLGPPGPGNAPPVEKARCRGRARVILVVLVDWLVVGFVPSRGLSVRKVASRCARVGAVIRGIRSVDGSRGGVV